MTCSHCYWDNYLRWFPKDVYMKCMSTIPHSLDCTCTDCDKHSSIKQDIHDYFKQVKNWDIDPAALEYVRQEIDPATGMVILFYNYSVPFDHIDCVIAFELDSDRKFPSPAPEKKCSCGTDAAGGGVHSNWCEKGKNQ